MASTTQSRSMTLFFSAVLFTLSLLLYYNVTIELSTFTRAAQFKKQLQWNNTTPGRKEKGRTKRALELTARFQPKWKINLDSNFKDNLTRLKESLQRLRTFENFAYFSDYDKNRKKCQEKKNVCHIKSPVRHYHACAVVGNGGILLNSSCGNEIDRHDYVIRMNMATINNYEQDVGRKTNLSFINSQGAKRLGEELLSNTRTVVQHLIPMNHSIVGYVKQLKFGAVNRALKSLQTLLKENNLNITVTYSFRNAPLIITRPLRETFLPTLKSPTSGLIAYILATKFCDVITLYGFYPFAVDMRNRTLLYHYYDNTYDGKIFGPRHNFSIEYDFLTLLHRKGLVRLVSDVCK